MNTLRTLICAVIMLGSVAGVLILLGGLISDDRRRVRKGLICLGVAAVLAVGLPQFERSVQKLQETSTEETSTKENASESGRETEWFPFVVILR